MWPARNSPATKRPIDCATAPAASRGNCKYQTSCIRTLDMLNDAFEALKKHDWGTVMGLLAPIEAAMTAAHGNAEAREELEKLLLAAVQSEISLDAKDFVCRMLTQVGGP